MSSQYEINKSQEKINDEFLSHIQELIRIVNENREYIVEINRNVNILKGVVKELLR